MQRNYDKALAGVLAHEGGYTNHPSDPGGPTNWGITIYDARKHWKANATAADVKAMPLSVAKAIYKSKYWDALRCDELPDGVDYAVFDYGVNSGVGRAGKVLRRCLKMSDNTWRVTDDVIAAANKVSDEWLAARICDERLAFLKRLKTWPTFGRGWGRRVAEVRERSGKMARQEPIGVGGLGAGALAEANGKGIVPVNTRAQETSTAGVGAAGVAAAVSAGDWKIVALAIVATIVVGVAAYYFWHWRQKVQQEALVPA